MRFFSKNTNNDKNFIINTGDDNNVKISGDKKLAPHAITPDEISNARVPVNDKLHSNAGAIDSLKKRMNISSDEPLKNEDSDNSTKKWPEQSTTINPDKKQAIVSDDTKSIDHTKTTLVEKVKRYTIDEHGHDMSENQKPLYQLKSVAEILMNDGETAMKNLSEKYGIDFDFGDTYKTSVHKKTDNAQTKTDAPVKPAGNAKPTHAFEKMVSDSEKRESQERLESLFPKKKEIKTNEHIVHTGVPDISDIDTHESDKTGTKEISNTATIRFTPIKDKLGNTDHIAMSSSTKYVELGDDYNKNISSKSTNQSLEKSEFEKFSPTAEITDIATGKKILHKLALRKRSDFFIAFVSALCVIALSVFLIPPVYDFIIANPKSAMFTCGAFLLVSVIANIKMFADFKNLITKTCGFDIFSSLCSIFSLILAVTAALTQQNAYYIILLCSIILFVRALCAFKETSYIAGNLKLVLNEKSKNAVALIDDPATTSAMAKNKIDGDVLAISHRNTILISDYIKHNEFSKKLSGRCPFLFYFTLAFCVISAIIAYFYYQNVFDAFYSAAVVACMSSLPTLFFIDRLPLSAATKKLNARGAMIAGMYGAEKIELTNAAHIHINDIFPAGSVKMYSMRVLSKNNIDDTFLRAASLTAAVNSPLEAIFNQIAGTNTSYTIPDSDTVKYEKNLGISGWVNNELLFIGNRSFMQAHGIQIPSLEVDKKILRKGYFPVYVATTDTACALIVIQYEAKPNVTKELRKITDLGVTLLVENCDPNITEEMLCDYFGLYEDSVKIMSNAGVHMLKNATTDTNECSAPAAYSGSHLNIIRIVNCASMIKRSNNLLTIMYVLFAVLGIMYFIYAAFSGLLSMPQQTTILLYALGTTVLSIIGFLIRKP